MKLHPGFEKRPDDPLFVDSVKTPLTEEEATYYLKTAWKNIYGEYPSVKSLALLWAQSLGETGRWKLLRCNNWGNIKRRKKDKTLKWTSYEAGENLTINGKFGHYMFYPYHPQTHFAAWDDPLSGAEYYIRFVSQRKRYKKAWAQVIKGDPIAYTKELKKAGYFTADLDHYIKGMVALTNEFKRKADKLMAWEPPQPEPEPIPEPEEPAESTEEIEPPAPVDEPSEPTPNVVPVPDDDGKPGLLARILQIIMQILGKSKT